MKSYYKTYIKPILDGIGDDARAALANDVLVANNISIVRGFGGKDKKEIAISNFYWSVITMYFNTRFINPREGFGNNVFLAKDKQKYTDIYAKLDGKTGNLDLPKKYHSIFQIKYDDGVGYRCRMRRKDKYPFYVVTDIDTRNAVRDAIINASRLPLDTIDHRLVLLKFIIANSVIKSTQPKGPKTNGRGHLAIATEIWDEMSKSNRILHVQQEINVVQSQKNITDDTLKAELQCARNKQQSQLKSIVDVLSNSQYTDDQLRGVAQGMIANITECANIMRARRQSHTDYDEIIENIKMNSNLPIQKLREHQK